MKMKRKILFFLESLGGGGAEKVLSTIVRNLDLQRFDVAVCVIVAGGKYDDEVSSQVRLYSLLKNPEAYHGIGKVWYRLKYHLIYDWLSPRWVYKLLIPHNNDVEIAFVEGLATKILSYSTNSKAKKLAWVHCDLKNQPWPIQQGIYKDNAEEADVYRRYQQVVCVSHSVEDIMREVYGLDHICTIYNPLDEKEILSNAQKDIHWDIDNCIFNIISIGRLEYQKGYDLLLPIIRRLKDDGERCHLWLVGDGTQRSTLENQVKELNLLEDVTFTGFIRNPYALLSKMNLFVCSSRAEGFSLVVAEALILKVPVLSMNCSGPNELLKDTKMNLCDSYEDLYNKIKEVIKGTRKIEVARKPSFLRIDYVMSQIETLLWGISEGSGHC